MAVLQHGAENGNNRSTIRTRRLATEVVVKLCRIRRRALLIHARSLVHNVITLQRSPPAADRYGLFVVVQNARSVSAVRLCRSLYVSAAVAGLHKNERRTKTNSKNRLTARCPPSIRRTAFWACVEKIPTTTARVNRKNFLWPKRSPTQQRPTNHKRHNNNECDGKNRSSKHLHRWRELGTEKFQTWTAANVLSDESWKRSHKSSTNSLVASENFLLMLYIGTYTTYTGKYSRVHRVRGLPISHIRIERRYFGEIGHLKYDSRSPFTGVRHRNIYLIKKPIR